MPASTDKFRQVAPNTGWQLDASGISDASVTSFGLVSATSLPTDTAVTLTVDRVNSSGVKTPTKMERIKGVISGSSVISCVRGVGGTAQAHSAGAVVEIVIDSTLWNDVVNGIIDGSAVAIPTHAATEETTPVDADEIGLIDSVASWVLKKLTWANLKATLASTFLSLTGGTMTGDVQLGETDIKLDAVLSADEKWSGIVIAGVSGVTTLAVGDLCYLNADDSRWELVDANLSDGYDKQLGICVLAGADGAATEMLVYGKVRSAAFPAFTVGSPLYISETAGDMTHTAPVTADSATRCIGIALTAEDLMFNPSPNYYTHI